MKHATVELRGGFGNQMFQICAALTARDMGYAIELDQGPLLEDSKRDLEIGGLASAFDIPITPGSGRSTRFLRRRREILTDPVGRFGDVHALLGKGRSDIVLRGYFQDRVNVEQHLPELRRHIAEGLPDHPESPTADAAVHVRRGDYVTEANTSAYHGNLQAAYYVAALEELRTKTELRTLLVYSDDVDFIAGTLAPRLRAELPGITVLIRDSPCKEPLAEVAHLSRYDSHVIANSTFSWWVASLSASDQVVGPTAWWAASSAPSADGLRWPEWVWL